jgi:AcrR family transcriptional regulator
MARLSPTARRDVIREAACNAFAAHGYEGASMREIAMAAGVTTPVLYDHFRSKQALYIDVLTSETDALIALTDELDVQSGGQAALQAGVAAFFRFARSRPHAWRLLFRDVPGHPQVAQVHREQQRRGDQAVARAIARMRGRGSDTLAAADILQGVAVRSMVNGLAAWWWDHPDMESVELVTIVTDLLRGRLVEPDDIPASSASGGVP